VVLAAALSPATSGCAQILDYRQDYYEATADGGGASTYCQGLSPAPVFCDDFDENKTSPFGFSYAHTANGSLALLTSESISSPASLLAQTDVVTSSGKTVDTSVYATLPLNFGQTFDGTLDFYGYVNGVDAPGGIAVLAQFGLTDGAGNGQYYVQLVATSNGAQPLTLQVAEDYFSTCTHGLPVDHSVSSVIPVGSWTNVDFSIHVPFSGGPGTATLVVNGGSPAVTTIHVPVQDFTPSIGIGVLYASTPSNGWSAAFDNVVFSSGSQSD
jgi:hypothetical protein